MQSSVGFAAANRTLVPVIGRIACPFCFVIVIHSANQRTNIAGGIAYVAVSMVGQLADFLGFGTVAGGAGIGFDAIFLTGCRGCDNTGIITMLCYRTFGQGADRAGFGSGAGGILLDMIMTVAGEFADGAGLLGVGSYPIVKTQVGLQEAFVISVNNDIIPLFLGTAIDHLSQVGTTVKCVMGDAFHAGRDGDPGHTAAITEGILIDFG